MDLTNKIKVINNYEKIGDTLLVDSIQGSLVEKGVFTKQQMADILNEQTTKDKAYKLLNTLLLQTDREYENFKECLLPDFDWLVTALDNTVVTEDEIKNEKGKL